MLPVYTLQLPKEGMDVILAGLNELPLKIARGVYDSALRQFQEQEQAAMQQESMQRVAAAADQHKQVAAQQQANAQQTEPASEVGDTADVK